MDGKAGRKTAARLLKKLCQRLGRQNIDFFNGTCLPTTYCSAPWWQQSWMGRSGGKTDVLACVPEFLSRFLFFKLP